MPDRTEIDALLIGALYGELGPADEARLAAHLESHPADRSALADLTRTRAAVRDSRLLAFQFDPPQAISALLLREASRRAPRPERETASWFQRFTRTFMAHPAMAAAAMIVLVASVAGTLYLRGTDQFAESKPPASAMSAPSDRSPTAATETPPAAATGRVAAPEPAPESTQNPGSQNLGAVGAGSASADTYRVGLEEARREVEQKQAAEKTKGEAAKDVDGSAPTAHAKVGKKSASIEVRPPPPQRIQLKELGDDDAADIVKSDRARDRRDGRDGLAQQGQYAGGAPGGGATATTPASPPAQPATPPAAMAVPDPAPATTQPGPREPVNDAKKAAPKPAVAANAPPPPPAAAPAPAKPTAPTTNDTSNTRGLRRGDKSANNSANNSSDDAKLAKTDNRDNRADDKPSQDKALLDWARKQKDTVVALVGANNCRAAANAAGEIYHRAPDYYAANVVTDRSIRPCLAYLNSERDRQERAKAARRAIQADEARSDGK